MASSVLSGHNFFLAIAKICALKSKDPHTQVGACVVNQLHQIVSTGYNGLPRGLDDSAYPWERIPRDVITSKYLYVVHAELNAITAAKCDLTNCVIYTTLFPCSSCAKIIIQVGLKAVYFTSDMYQATPDGQAALKMLNEAQIHLEQLPDIDLKITKLH